MIFHTIWWIDQSKASWITIISGFESGRTVSWITIISSFNKSHHQYQITRSKLHRIILLDGLFFDSLIFKGPVHTSTSIMIIWSSNVQSCSQDSSETSSPGKLAFSDGFPHVLLPKIRLETARGEINKRITRGNLGECLKHQPALLL